MPEKPKATVIIPTLNEAENIGSIIGKISATGCAVIVSDDGSSDGTGAIVRKCGAGNPNVVFLDHSAYPVPGLSMSVIDAAKLAPTEKIVVMDADFQHPVEKLEELISALDSAEIAVGCRIRCENWSPARRVISAGATAIARAALLARGAPSCADPVSGFFAFRKSVLLKIDEKRVVKGGFKVLLDMLKQLDRSTTLAEVGFVFVGRKGGSSKFNSSQIIRFLQSLAT